MNPRSLLISALTGLCAFATAQETPGFNDRRTAPERPRFPEERGPAADARAGRPGPWDNDVLVYYANRKGRVEPVTTFERAGVPTIARLGDGRLIAAHQHFPAAFGPHFDKVAVHFSTDDGRTWSAPQVIQLTSTPRRGPGAMPAIYSAISRDGIRYEFEPGQRFGVEDRMVIDCAVVLHRGVFHLYSPDNGDAPPGRGGEGARPGIAYHATSPDGLTFTRAADVQLEGRRHWLGNAQSEGQAITFYGTGDGLWTATSEDGAAWKLTPAPAIRGGDPGVVATRDGGLIVVITGPPRRSQR